MKWDTKTQAYAAAFPVAAVAVIAGIVSYGHIEALALHVHQTLTAARLLPFAVDLLIVAGSVVVLAGYWLGWLCVVAGVAGTLFANVESGLPYGPLAATVAAWPAVAFTVASFTLERWLNKQVSRGGTGGQTVAESSATPADRRESAGAQNYAPVPPEPVVATCGHEAASTPEERVVQDYLHGRDCLGETPSQRALAAAHNVSRPKVAALVGPLNGGSHA